MMPFAVSAYYRYDDDSNSRCEWHKHFMESFCRDWNLKWLVFSARKHFTKIEFRSATLTIQQFRNTKMLRICSRRFNVARKI